MLTVLHAMVAADLSVHRKPRPRSLSVTSRLSWRARPTRRWSRAATSSVRSAGRHVATQGPTCLRHVAIQRTSLSNGACTILLSRCHHVQRTQLSNSYAALRLWRTQPQQYIRIALGPAGRLAGLAQQAGIPTSGTPLDDLQKGVNSLNELFGSQVGG